MVTPWDQPTANDPARTACRCGDRRRAAFSIIEVTMALFVFGLAILGALTALQRGLVAVDTARSYTYASQVMQSEFERLRMYNWSQLQELQDSGATTVTTTAVTGFSSAGFKCTRSIQDLKTEMKRIVLTSTWSGHDGRQHSARLITQYGKLGMYDYFYTSH